MGGKKLKLKWERNDVVIVRDEESSALELYRYRVGKVVQSVSRRQSVVVSQSITFHIPFFSQSVSQSVYYIPISI